MYDFCEKAAWTKENKILNLWHCYQSPLEEKTIRVLFEESPYFVIHPSVNINNIICEIFRFPEETNLQPHFDTAQTDLIKGYIRRTKVQLPVIGHIEIRKVS